MNINADMIDSIFVTNSPLSHYEKEKVVEAKAEKEVEKEVEKDVLEIKHDENIEKLNNLSSTSWDETDEKEILKINLGECLDNDEEKKEKNAKNLLGSSDILIDKSLLANNIISTTSTSSSSSSTSYSTNSSDKVNQITDSIDMKTETKLTIISSQSQIMNSNKNVFNYFPKVQWRLLAEGKRIYTADYAER